MSPSKRVAQALADSSHCRELFATLATELGSDPALEGPVDGLPWAVIDPGDQDILGAGASLDEALADALRTVRAWGDG